jgi:ABC-type sugar transport system permease subunit
MTKKYTITDIFQAFFFMLPAAIMLVVFVYGPLLTSFGYSFFSFRDFKPDFFVGLKNFKEAFSDILFRNSIRLTFQWVLFNTVFPTITGLLLAILLEFLTRRSFLAGASRTILFMPMMMSLVSVGLLWRLIYDPNIGMIVGLLRWCGINVRFNALANAKTALMVSYIPVLWQGAGFSMVVFSAALQGIPQDIIEVSMVEGANKTQQIRFIMLPMIISTIMMVMMINMISGFKAFDLLYVLTKGGPGAATNITAIYSYNQAFWSYRIEYASAIMLLLFFCVIIFLAVFSAVSSLIVRKFGV